MVHASYGTTTAFPIVISINRASYMVPSALALTQISLHASHGMKLLMIVCAFPMLPMTLHASYGTTNAFPLTLMASHASHMEMIVLALAQISLHASTGELMLIRATTIMLMVLHASQRAKSMIIALRRN
jgi:hypothetical protein